MDYKTETSDNLFVLRTDIRSCERKLYMVNSRIAKLTKKRSPIHNMKLILPLAISLFNLIFSRLALHYIKKNVKEANARGIYHNIDLGIFNSSFINWLLVDLPRHHILTIVFIIIAVYCIIRLYGRYGNTRLGVLPSRIAGFFGDINYNVELNKAYKEQARIGTELDELKKREESIAE